MNEDFLHYLWKYRLFGNALTTTLNEPIEVIETGFHNHDSGPDFLNAKIKIGHTTWVGNIEIHVNASDWITHAHHLDKAFQNVILHVVFNDDFPDSSPFLPLAPCTEVGKLIDYKLFYKYKDFLAARGWVPCHLQIKETERLTLSSWFERMLAERLTANSVNILKIYQDCSCDWNETYYRLLSRSFGLKINGDSFELLSQKLLFSIIQRHRSNLFQLEALLFGVAGFLEEKFDDEYPNRLKLEFEFLRKKYDLEPMPVHHWQFLRMRPAGFPTIRLAQFASFWHRNSIDLDAIFNLPPDEVAAIHFDAEVSAYWKDHYLPDKKSLHKSKVMGSGTINSLIINTIPPLIFAYGQQIGDLYSTERAVQVLERIGPEINHETKEWINIGIKPTSAAETQALHYMKKNYCDQKRCLHCRIGHSLLKMNDN
ncbi:MAG: DUF2851 family protein [Bacteroidetes bacterium]|nr:DUF2851 family protein [Bacteroidota bacterium]